MNTIPVNTDSPYDVLVGRGLLAQAGALAARIHPPCTAAIVADETVAALYLGPVAQSFERAGFRVVSYRFPPGERSKTMEELSRLLDVLAQNELGRSDLLVALGGGVTGDLSGFAAATFQRGIDFAQIPTTLLAAVDSSVGGKTAVNLPSGKNLAGAFWQPKQVICDCAAFDTLPREELASGASECVKYAMLGNPGLLTLLTDRGLAAAWEEIVPVCVAQKADVVAQDERERGLRTLLNFGHTVGHAAERLGDYRIRHGEGVAMGMAILTRAAERRGFCEAGASERLERALSALHLPIACPFGSDELAAAALFDKKRRRETIALVLPRSVGDCVPLSIPTSELAGWISDGMEAMSCR